MKDYVVESKFKHNGLKCVVVMRVPGYRCGYVGIPKKHFLYGKDYDYVNSHFEFVILNEDKRIGVGVCLYLQCHGGVTYSKGGKGSNYPIKSNLWWFGFDCAHAWDKNDYETAKKLFKHDKEALKRILYNERLDNMFSIGGDKVRTLEYVSNECRKLAEQLADHK